MNIFERIQKIEAQVKRIAARPFVYYDKGTFTPTYLGSATAGTTTYSIQVGNWTRIGRMVYLQGRVDWTASTGTGNAQIGGLPFTSANTTNGHVAIPLYTVNLTFANGSVQGIIAPNVTFFTILSPATNAAGTTVQMEAAGTIIFGGHYFV